MIGRGSARNGSAGRRRLHIRMTKALMARFADEQATVARSRVLAEAKARLVTLRAGFSDWIWTEAPLASHDTELLGPLSSE